MPKQIKKKKLPKEERTSCILGIIVMFLSLALSSLLILLIHQSSADKEPKALSLAAFSAYAVFTVFCLIHFVQAVITFKKLESYASIFTAMLTGVSLFGMLVNVQLMLALLFTAVGSEGMVTKIVGEAGMNNFMTSQSSAWTLMIAGIASAFAVGFIDTIRLSKQH